MDNIIIYAENQREHDDRLEQVFKRLKESGITSMRKNANLKKLS